MDWRLDLGLFVERSISAKRREGLLEHFDYMSLVKENFQAIPKTKTKNQKCDSVPKNPRFVLNSASKNPAPL
jgi:hypothetical protein